MNFSIAIRVLVVLCLQNKNSLSQTKSCQPVVFWCCCREVAPHFCELLCWTHAYKMATLVLSPKPEEKKADEDSYNSIRVTDFPAELQEIISEIVPSTDPLDSPTFN